MTDALIHAGKFLEFYKRGRWEFVKRSNAAAVVAIAALTDNDEVILIEQKRATLGEAGRVVVEIPAGLVGDDHRDDSIEAAARRELIEECGYNAQQVVLHSHGPSSAGLCDEIISMVIATGLTKVGPGGGIGGEDITTYVLAYDDVDAWLAQRVDAGIYIDPKVFAALYILRTYRALSS